MFRNVQYELMLDGGTKAAIRGVQHLDTGQAFVMMRDISSALTGTKDKKDIPQFWDNAKLRAQGAESSTLVNAAVWLLQAYDKLQGGNVIPDGAYWFKFTHCVQTGRTSKNLVLTMGSAMEFIELCNSGNALANKSILRAFLRDPERYYDPCMFEASGGPNDQAARTSQPTSSVFNEPEAMALDVQQATASPAASSVFNVQEATTSQAASSVFNVQESTASPAASSVFNVQAPMASQAAFNGQAPISRAEYDALLAKIMDLSTANQEIGVLMLKLGQMQGAQEEAKMAMAAKVKEMNVRTTENTCLHRKNAELKAALAVKPGFLLDRDAELGKLQGRLDTLTAVIASRDKAAEARDKEMMDRVEELKQMEELKREELLFGGVVADDDDRYVPLIPGEPVPLPRQRLIPTMPAEEQQKLYDKGLPKMLAKFGMKLDKGMLGRFPCGRWRCGCKASVLQSLETIMECAVGPACDTIMCYCEGFSCKKTDTKALDKHFNTFCPYFDPVWIFKSIKVPPGQEEPTDIMYENIVKRRVVAQPPPPPVPQKVQCPVVYLEEVEAWMRQIVAVMKLGYPDLAHCYRAILEVPWRGVKPLYHTDRSDGERPRNTPPWPFRHPSFPAPFAWQIFAHRPVYPFLCDALLDYSMYRPADWGKIENVFESRKSGTTLRMSDGNIDGIVKNRMRAAEWMEKAAAVMKLEYASHAECYKAVLGVVEQKGKGCFFPWPFRHPDYPAPKGWEHGISTPMDLYEVLPDYSLERLEEWPRIRG